MSLEDLMGDVKDEITAIGGDTKEKLASIGDEQTEQKTMLEAQAARIDAIEKGQLKGLEKDYGKKTIPTQTWSWARFAYAQATKDWKMAPYEYEQVQRYQDDIVEKRIQGPGMTSGGALIPPQYVAELIDTLKPATVVDKLGVRTLTNLTGAPVSFPKKTSDTNAYWISPEGSDISASDFATGRLEFAPHKCAALVKLTNDIVAMTNPSIEASVRADIVTTLQQALDLSFFQGTGVSGQPTGLDNWSPAISVTLADWEAVSTDKEKAQALKDLIKTVAAANALEGNLKFVCNVNSYFAISKLQDTNGRFYMQSDMNAGVPSTPAGSATLFGYPIVMSPNVSATGGTEDRLWFGNWNDAVLAIWANMEISASTETSTAFQKDELWIRAIMKLDSGVRREDSFTCTKEVR